VQLIRGRPSAELSHTHVAPAGAGNLAHINGDAVFLVRQVGNNFAFASPG
jgi:hypothetical protein